MQVEKLKLLVTGYKDFTGGHNPCQDIAKVVNGKTISHKDFPGIEVEVIGTELDVSWNKTWEELEQVVTQNDKIDAIISFGMWEGLGKVALEQTAWNWKDGYTDAEGNIDKGPIIENGPDVLPSTLPYTYLFEKINEDSDILDAEYDDSDTQSYLCNYIAYQELYHYGSKIPFKGFIHITDAFGNIDLAKIILTGEKITQFMAEWLIVKKQEFLDVKRRYPTQISTLV